MPTRSPLRRLVAVGGAAATPDRRRLGLAARRCRTRRRADPHGAGVDAAFTEIEPTSGKGSQARRAALLTALFGAATAGEQTFLRRLLGGELRQGALRRRDGRRGRQGVRHPGRRRATGGDARRRTARRRGRGARRAAPPRSPSSGCRSAARSGRCSRRPPPTSPMRSSGSAARRSSRRSSTAPGCRSTATAMTSRSTPEAWTMSPRGCPRWSRPRSRCRSPPSSPTARRSRCVPTGGRTGSR